MNTPEKSSIYFNLGNQYEIIKNLSNLNIPSLVKPLFFIISSLLMFGEVIEFIKLRGYENQIAFCLFKLIAYSTCMIISKSDNSALLIVLKNIKELNENILNSIEEFKEKLSQLNK